MSADFVIFPGMPISGPTGEGICRVGAIIFDHAGACFGTSARHALESEKSSAILDLTTGREIGQRMREEEPWADGQPFHRAIGRFLIPPAPVAQVRMATPFRSIQGVADPLDLVGSSVFWLEDSYGNAPAEVVGFGGAIAFVNPFNSRATVMTEVIEIQTSSAHVRIPGEAGTLIVDERDQAVGLLICRLGSTCFLAPLSSYLDEMGAMLADDRTSKIAGVDTGLEAVRSELVQVGVGSSRMRQELEGQRGIIGASDEEAPPDLAALLEAAA